MEQWTGSQLGKEYIKAFYCHSVYLTYIQSNIMRNAGLDEAQAGIRIAGRNTSNLRYADNIMLMAECEEELKSFLMRVKSWLNIQHSKNEDHGIRPITSWQENGKEWKQ